MAKFIRAAKKAGRALVKGSKKLNKAVDKHKGTIENLALLAAGGPVGAGLKIGAGKAAAKLGGKAAVSAAKKKLPQPDIEKLARKVAGLEKGKTAKGKGPFKLAKGSYGQRQGISDADVRSFFRGSRKLQQRQKRGPGK